MATSFAGQRANGSKTKRGGESESGQASERAQDRKTLGLVSGRGKEEVKGSGSRREEGWDGQALELVSGRVVEEVNGGRSR